MLVCLIQGKGLQEKIYGKIILKIPKIEVLKKSKINNNTMKTYQNK